MNHTIRLLWPVLAADSRPIDEHRRAFCLLLRGLRDEVGASRLGDCLVLGLRNPSLLVALADSLADSGLDQVRTFSAGVPVDARRLGAIALDSLDLDEHGMRAIRGRYQVHRIGVFVLANDFAELPSTMLQRLDPILADRLLMIVCGQGTGISAPVVQADLSRQTGFSSVTVGAAGSAWVAARLQRNFCV